MAAADHLSPSPWRQHRLLWVIAAITLGLSLALAIDLTPWLPGPAAGESDGLAAGRPRPARHRAATGDPVQHANRPADRRPRPESSLLRLLSPGHRNRGYGGVH